MDTLEVQEPARYHLLLYGHRALRCLRYLRSQQLAAAHSCSRARTFFFRPRDGWVQMYPPYWKSLDQDAMIQIDFGPRILKDLLYGLLGSDTETL